MGRTSDGRWSERCLFYFVLSCLLFPRPEMIEAVSDNIACGSDVQTNVCLPRNYSTMDIPLISEYKGLLEINARVRI